MSSPSLRIEYNGPVATLWLARPELGNAFDDALIAALTSSLRELGSSPQVRAVVLAGEGKHFCAGADLNWMKRMAGYSYEENLADSRNLAVLMATLRELPKPTIARVQGAAFGGGVGLVACCDIALASEAATFCLSEVKLGLVPAVISPYVVEAIGARQARRYFLTAERFDAACALRLGLVQGVVPAEGLDAAIAELTTQLCANGPQALTVAKDLVGRVAGQARSPAQQEELAQLIAQLRASLEGREGITAFLEKRKPSW